MTAVPPVDARMDKTPRKSIPLLLGENVSGETTDWAFLSDFKHWLQVCVLARPTVPVSR